MNDTRRHEIEALQRLLDSRGGNTERWPDGAPARFLPLIAADREAARLHAEAQALDRMLDAGHAEPPLDALLAERIIATALAGKPGAQHAKAPAAGTASGNVVPLRRSAAPPSAPTYHRASSWRAAGLMAASLLIGLYIGGSGRFAPLAERVAQIAGISIEGDPVLALFGQDGQGDEDFL